MPNVTQYTIAPKFIVDASFIYDVMTTALEHGIDYWADLDHITTADYGAGRIAISFKCRDAEDPKDPWKLVDAAVIATGIERALSGNASVNSYTRGAIVNALGSKDAGDIDADAADVIVQFGLFGKIVFG